MDWFQNIEDMQDTCVAFGSFDGIHKGHLAVIERLVSEGKKRGLKTALLSITSKAWQAENKVLTTEEEKAYLLQKSGLDAFHSYEPVGELPSKEEIIRKLMLGTLGAKVIVAGEEDEDIGLLEKICAEKNISLIKVESVLFRGGRVTAGLVRKAFMECRFEDVAEMCGHNYIMIGKVEHGKALGRTVGMPTANLGVPDTKLMPPSGVYATLTDVDKEYYKGLTNIGTRPSVDDMSYITIETFLLDFLRDIYDKRLVMEVQLYIRGVQKFKNLDEVQKQVQKDLERVKGA